MQWGGGSTEKLPRGGRRSSWKSRSPTLLSMCQQGGQAGLEALFSEPVELGILRGAEILRALPKLGKITTQTTYKPAASCRAIKEIRPEQCQAFPGG